MWTVFLFNRFIATVRPLKKAKKAEQMKENSKLSDRND